MVKTSGKFSQYSISIASIVLLSAICYFFRDFIDYRIVALVLFLAVSILAILYDFLPVMVAAILSALILNILFIEPIFHYKIDNAENTLLFFMYLLIALLSAVFSSRIRKQERKLREKEEKEQSIKLYNTLLNSLSHELRIPITTIIGTIDTLKDAHANLSHTQREDLLTEIEIASFRLNDQVENLLNMSRLETGNLELKKDWTDMNELVYMVLQKFPQLDHHRLQFAPKEDLPLFKIDFGLMEQVFYSLIQNGLMYTPSESEIRIEIENENDQLKIMVSDNGPGFPEDLIPKVFDKFYRLPNSKVGGTGLGLSIVKGIVEAHQGTIQLSNQSTGGANFTIIIPCEVSYLKNLKNE